MKKFLICLFSLVLMLIIGVDYAGASANDFTISSFKAEYYLDKSSDGHSTLKTVESITALFPDTDQNHGIERVIPMEYDGHRTGLKIQSVKDSSGVDIEYSTDTQNDNLVLRIGDSSVYVHGKTNYVITYTQRDVTKYYADTGRDEFYWDVNGTGWSQPFGEVSAKLYLGKGLSANLTSNQFCYYGVLNSNTKCNISVDNDTISTAPVSLNAGENMTISVGFNQNTFAAYSMSLIERIEKNIILIEIFVAVILFIVICILKATKDKSDPGRGVVIPEYLPPKDIDIAVSSVICSRALAWTSVMIVDFAVRHNIQIIDNGEEKARKKIYTLRLISLDKLNAVEKLVVEAFFGDNLLIGSEYQIKANKNDYGLTRKLNKVYKQVTTQVNDEGYYIKNKKIYLTMSIIATIIFVQSIIIFLIFIDFNSAVAVLMIGIFASMFGFIVINISKPLSKKGRELADYLDGLKMYIKIAEADRIKVLQSPQGVSRQSVNVNDGGAVLRLYERVLPYAVLFGIEKEWTEVLGKYYEQQNIEPDWYSAPSAFNAIMFASAMSSFSTSVAASSTYTSSSSGGSSGGGFSGGGGGGGGGGGW